MLRKSIKFIIIRIIDLIFLNMPNFLFDFCFNFIYSYNKNYALSLIKKFPLNKLTQSDNAFAKQYHILTNAESEVFKVHVVDEERYEQARTSDVYEVTKNNFITLRKHEIAIYCFPNARIRAKSDIVKIEGNVYWDKANRPEFAMTIPGDIDFISIDKLSRKIVTFEEKIIRRFDSGFSLCGVNTDTWSHFIFSYLPKLIALDELKLGSRLSLFVPFKILENNKELISFVINYVNNNKDLEIVYVDDDEVIECAKLYYCNAIGYLCDHSTYVHPSSIFMSDYGAKAIQKVSNRMYPLIKISQPRKLYIGRGAGRNLFNAAEVEKYFISNGFEIVRPHLMTLEEKINVFGNATHICGPTSSGFANMIFCRNKIKVLGFINFARCFDTFFSGLSYSSGLNHEILFMTGHEEVNNNINNSYFIELDRIIECCNSIKFLD